MIFIQISIIHIIFILLNKIFRINQNYDLIKFIFYLKKK